MGIRILETAVPNVPQRLKPRKSPIQARSGATVEAIHEAAIQVLLGQGISRLTTTRVAERAGVSVGTLYQYFPNKQALLYAILIRHFEEMADSLEGAAAESNGKKLAEIGDRIADAYVSVKAARPDATTALYRIAGAIDQFRLSDGIYKRLVTAIVEALKVASDASFDDLERTASTLLSALAGLSRGTFANLVYESEALVTLGEEARLLSRSYLAAASTRPSDC